MLIDGFTVLAQIFNFLILVALLKRFLYRPVLEAIAAREMEIQTRLAESETEKTAAQKEKQNYEQKQQEWANQKKQLLLQSQTEMEQSRQRILADAKQEAEAIRQQAENRLKKDFQNLSNRFQAQLQEEIFALTRKTLADLASISLETQICSVFIQRLQNLEPEQKKAWFRLAENPEPLLIRSAFPLSEPQIHELQLALAQSLGHEHTLTFDYQPTLVSGIELVTPGFKVAWNIQSYLEALRKNLAKLLEDPLAQQELARG